MGGLWLHEGLVWLLLLLLLLLLLQNGQKDRDDDIPFGAMC
jgi:hypothetical protein